MAKQKHEDPAQHEHQPAVVDDRQVLPQAEYKARISKLKISAEVERFRKKYKRGDH